MRAIGLLIHILASKYLYLYYGKHLEGKANYTLIIIIGLARKCSIKYHVLHKILLAEQKI
jgi:hypothetical protein